MGGRLKQEGQAQAGQTTSIGRLTLPIDGSEGEKGPPRKAKKKVYFFGGGEKGWGER